MGFLFTLNWPEPFGLVVIESLALGTPVITRRFGAMPEIMVDGVTGFLCDDLEEKGRRIFDLPRIDRAACRRYVEENFNLGLMAGRYEEAYANLLNGESALLKAISPATEQSGELPGPSI